MTPASTPQPHHGTAGFCTDHAKPTWVRYEGPDDSVFVDITRLTDGRIMCCLCFDYKVSKDLHEIEPGVVTDVCEECWVLDQAQLAARLLH